MATKVSLIEVELSNYRAAEGLQRRSINDI